MRAEKYYVPHEALILTKQNTKDQFNASKILAAYDTYIKNENRLVEPWEIEIHLSGNCSFACKECSYATRHTGQILAIPEIEAIFSSISKTKTHCVFFSGGGDPFAWQKWEELLELREKHIPNIPIGVSTNLFGLPTKMDLNKINFYQIHLSGYDEASYKEQIGWDAYDILSGNLSRVCKSNAHVTVKVILNEFVCNHFCEFLDFLEQYDIDNVIFKRPQNFLQNEKKESVDYAKVLNSLYTHSITKKYGIVINNLEDLLYYNEINVETCHIVRSGLYCLIRENGDVFPCIASTYEDKNSIGNIKKRSLHQILADDINWEMYDKNMLCGFCPTKACRHFRFNKVIEMEYDSDRDYSTGYIPIML